MWLPPTTSKLAGTDCRMSAEPYGSPNLREGRGLLHPALLVSRLQHTALVCLKLMFDMPRHMDVLDLLLSAKMDANAP